MKKRGFNRKQPPRPHPGELPNRMDNQGHIMNAAEQAKLGEKRKKSGLCPDCGLVKTHTVLFGLKRIPIQSVPHQVYKGKCLKCNSITKVQLELNEPCEGVHDMNNRASVDTGRQHSGSNSLGENTSNISRPSNNGGRSHQETGRCRIQRDSGGTPGPHYENTNEGSGRPGQGEHSRERNGMGRSHGGNNEGEIQNRGKYFSTLQHQSEAHAEPSYEIQPVGVPIMVGGMDDDVSVISMDPSIMTTNSGAKSNENEESLGKITEEQDSNDVSGSAQDQEHNSSSGNRRHSQTLSNASANPSTRAGSAPARGEGDRFNRLLERKLAAETSGNAARAAGANHNSNHNNAPQAAPPAGTGHVHFKNEDVMSARGAHAVRKGTILDARIQEKERANVAGAAGHVRSNSESHQASPPMGQKSHVRSSTHESAVSAVEDGRGHLARMDPWEESRGAKPGELDGCGDSANDGNTRADTTVDHPNKNIATPGAQSVKDGDKKVSLYDRKMANDTSTKGKSIPDKDRSNRADTSQRCLVTDESISDSDAQTLIAECSCCRELMDVLKRNSSSTQAVILMALGKLRDCLLVAHGLTNHDHSISMDSLEGSGRSEIAFPNSGWTKVIMMVMSSQASNAIVQSELLHTLWSIVTMHPRYISDLTSNPDMKQIITTMETHIKEESVQEYGCGLIACIAACQKHALRLLIMCNGKFIHRLMAALYFQDRQGNVQINALKALFRLSSALLSSDTPTESFANTMGGYDPKVGDSSVNSIDAVLHVMHRYLTNTSIQMHGNRLLWNIFSPDAILDPDYVDILVGKILQHIKAAMAFHQKSQVFTETAACLLSKMSCFGSDSLDREAFLHVAVETMKAHCNSGIVVLHAFRCLTNVCSRSQTYVLSQPVVDGIPVIISCMKTFQDNIIVQSEACAAISAIAVCSPSNKERIHHLGGIGRINCAYDTYSMTPYDDQCVVTKIRACIALTTLAVDPIVLSDIREKGILVKFEGLLNEDQNMPGKLRHAIQDLLALASNEENMDRYLEFWEGASEEDTCDILRANLRVVATPDFTPNRILYLRSRALCALEQFPASASVHENGCKLFACLFDLASHCESVAHDSIAPEELEIIPRDLEAMTLSLARHNNNPSNAAAACSALQNFCVLLSLSSFDDAPGLGNRLSRSLAEEVIALNLYREDEQTLEQVTGALWALCAVREGLALSFDTDGTIGLIIGAMNRFTNSVDLHKHGIGLLGLFFSVSNKVLDFVNDELVTVIMRFIDQEVDNDDAMDFIDTAVNIILIMTSEGFGAVTILLRNERLIDSIVDCMYKFLASPSIRGAGIGILTNIALDNYTRADVCQRGGMTITISALNNLKHDPIVVCRAFASLANLIIVADIEVIRGHDVAGTFVRAMTAHPQNLSIQIGAASALWALSSKHDDFKDDIVNLGGAEAIAEAMARFIGSKQMQEKGFVVTWSLSVPIHLKMRIGRCAIEAVANGLSAHLTSEKACENAMGCLKCLSTIPSNKELLEDNGVVDLIYSCMRLHSEKASVCKAALGALCNICVNVDTNEVSDITRDELDTVVTAMRAHQTIKGVQENAIILLKNFTLSRANVIVLGQEPFLVPLVHLAVFIHNDHFRGQADNLLRVLPALKQ
mmetsp:Transcript_27539/g.58846  ORF Transcript_27539/g.58846 Transcript_27539/m.58846 type:complete len:1633 (-) Transcript_27539:1946-6844(-)